MRRYPSDSPEAMARVVALALVVDGAIDPGELEALKTSSCCFRLGIDPCRFEQIVDEFCDDLRLSGERKASGQYALSEGCIKDLLGDLCDPALRKQALDMMLGIVTADGLIAREESALIAQAIDCWKLNYRAPPPTTSAKPNWQAQYRRAAGCY